MRVAITSDSVISNEVLNKFIDELKKHYDVVLSKMYRGGEVPKLVKELSNSKEEVDLIVWISYPDACTYLDVAIGFWRENVSIGNDTYQNYLVRELGYRPGVININVSPVYKNWDPPHDQVCIRAWDSYGAGPHDFAGFSTSGSEFLTEAGIANIDAPSATEKDPTPHYKEMVYLVKDLDDEAIELSNDVESGNAEFPKEYVTLLSDKPAPQTKIHAMWIVESGTRLANWIDDNGDLPRYVRTPIGALSPERWSYLAAKLISTTDVTTQLEAIEVATNESAGNTYTGSVTFEVLKDMSVRYSKFIEETGIVPRYVRISENSSSTVGWKEFTYMLARTLRWYHKNASWPNIVYIKPVGTIWPDNVRQHSVLCCTWKEGCGECDSKLYELANKLADPNSVTNTVREIARYVAYNIDYAYYYNSRLGACGVLESGYGNCCDQTNLLISLLRRAKGYWGTGIPCMYEHIYGKWGSGYYGHVRARVYLPEEGWVMVDPSMVCGRFLGECDYYTVEVWGRYRCLPFSMRYSDDSIRPVRLDEDVENGDFKYDTKMGVIIGMGGAPKKGGMA